MELCNAIYYFKTVLKKSELEIEEIKFKTREAGQRFAWGVKAEIDTPNLTPVIDCDADEIKIFGITFSWPRT